MRHLQGSVAHFSCLLTEDRPKQPLLRGKLRLSLRSHLAHQNVTGTHLRTNADNASVIQIFQRIVTDARHVSRNFFRSELGIPRLCLIFFHMHGSINIFLHQSFTEEYGILVVVAFPCHKSDQRILAQSQLAAVRGRTVRNHFALLHMHAFLYDRLLVITVGLVTAGELHQTVLVLLPVVTGHPDNICRHKLYGAGLSRHHADAGVHSRFRLHTGTNHRRLSEEQRHCLSLHVGTHQCTVRVVVLQERNECRSYREYHLRRHVHIIKHSLRIFLRLCLITTGNAVSPEIAVLVKGRGCLRHVIIIFLVRRHVDCLFRNARILRITLVNLPVRRLHKTIFVDSRIGRQRVDQTDIRSLRRLDGAHSAIMRIMYVTHLESGTVSGKTAGTQRGKTSLVSQLAERVILVHELRQLG